MTSTQVRSTVRVPAMGVALVAILALSWGVDRALGQERSSEIYGAPSFETPAPGNANAILLPPLITPPPATRQQNGTSGGVPTGNQPPVAKKKVGPLAPKFPPKTVPVPPAGPSAPSSVEKVPKAAKKAPLEAENTPCDDGSACGGFCCPPSIWSKVPPVTKMPPVGWFTAFPTTTPGYYSLRDFLMGDYREKAPNFPMSRFAAQFNSFYDNDYRYLDNPNNTQTDFFDPIKRIHLGDDWLLSFGGEERLRFMNEINSRLTGKNNNYDLLRSRAYADVWFNDRFRVFVEILDARTYNQDLRPLAIDANNLDLQNLFAEFKLLELFDNPVYFRGGRQEMLFGSQRLISPLDWANTRRTFQGYRGYWHSEKLDVDLFGVQPVLIDPQHFDSPDDGQWFTGAWVTYKPQPGHFIDMYYLNLDNARTAATGLGGVKGAFNTSTMGTRYAGKLGGLMWDLEGMCQFGEYVNTHTAASAFTTGLGYQFVDLPMMPALWINYDFASGDNNPGADPHGTFNQLFPFGHYYFGFIDDVGRQNIEDLSFQGTFWLTNWIYTVTQYHMFSLASGKDALYSAGGAVLRQDKTGKAGTDVGNELDWFTNFHIGPHQDVLVGYSHLFAGDFIRKTATTAAAGRSPELFYVQYTFRW